MKTKIQNVNITDLHTIRGWVNTCVTRHYRKRRDFRRLMLIHGYQEDLAEEEKQVSWDTAIDSVSLDIIKMINNRKLDLPPVHISEKMDKNSGKERLIGCESALQQCLDYIAVFSCEKIWRRRFDLYQASSMVGKGQIYIKNKVEKALKKNQASIEYAKRHGRHYTDKYKYYAKTDVKKCFPSARIDKFLSYFRQDCKNVDILWLWETLLRTHRVEYYSKSQKKRLIYEGFLIGALTSQYAMLYMLSFASHRLREQVNFVACFMDDFVILHSNRKVMKTAILDLEQYLKTEFELTIKPTWSIQKLEDTPIDFVGYRIYSNGKSELRPRNWKKVRKLITTDYLTFKQSKSLASLKGMVDHTSSYKIRTDYHFNKVWRKARCIIKIQNQMKNQKH